MRVDLDKEKDPAAALLIAEATAYKQMADRLVENRERRVASGWPSVSEYFAWWYRQRYELHTLARRVPRHDGSCQRVVRCFRRVEPTIGHLPMLAVRRTHIGAAMASPQVAELANDTQAHTLMYLTAMFQDAIDVGMVEHDETIWQLHGLNPCRGVEAGGAPRQDRARISPAEIRRLLLEARTNGTPEGFAFIVLILYCGLRSSEACGLRWSDVLPRVGDTANDRVVARIVVRERKNGRTDTVPIYREVMDAMQACRQDGCDLVLPHGYRHVLRLFNQAAAAAGCQVGVSPYSLRHAHAEALDRAGVQVATISAALGHSNLSTTDAYLRAARRTDRVAELAPSAIDRVVDG